jgi:hypothetical protein
MCGCFKSVDVDCKVVGLQTQMLNEMSTEDRIRMVIGQNEDSSDVQAMLSWEQQIPPGGKWKGVNARQWGKVGIEVRLTGICRYSTPVTEVGKQVAVFADMVEVETPPVLRDSDSRCDRSLSTCLT